MSRAAYELRPTTLGVFKNVFKRHLQLAWRNKSSLLNSLAFFIITISIFHIAIGPYELSQDVSVGIIFTCLIFAMTLSTETLIISDYRDGVLEQMHITGVMPEVIMAAKSLAHSLVFSVAFIVVIPIAVLLLGLETKMLFDLTAAGLLTIFISTLVILFGSSLTLGMKSSILMPILVLPLTLPVLIFATLSVYNSSYILLLVALLLFSIPVFIVGANHAVKVMVEFD